MNEEIWKVIDKFPMYAISTHGRVKRIAKHPGAVCRGVIGKIIKANPNTRGYLFVKLAYYENNKHNMRPVRVHRLVAEAFIKNPLGKNQINHIDGDKLNNHVSNLEWVTHKENIQHAFANKLYPIGERSYLAKLTKEKVQHILYLLNTTNISLRKLGEMFEVNYGAVVGIKNAKSWKHIAHCPHGVSYDNFKCNDCTRMYS